MNEEEKEAIEYYENNEYSFGFETDLDIENFKKAIGIEETDEDTFERHQIRFKTLLNLIEKQFREIEELKDFNTKLQATKDRLDIYDKENTLEIEKLKKEIEELNKENTRQQELIGNIHQKWKDKIRHIRDKAECMDYYSLNDVIDDLTKLIGE